MIKNKFVTLLIFLTAYLLNISEVLAQGISLNLDGLDSNSLSSKIIYVIALMTILSLAPAIAIMITSFTRIVIVLSLTRTAIGLQQTPPNIVITSLAIFLTCFVMSPTFVKAYDEGVLPLINGDVQEMEALNRLWKPFQAFMMKNVRHNELQAFIGLKNQSDGSKSSEINKDDVPFYVLVPAFMISELKKAFEMGFLIFLPFMIIDILVASTLMAMGMMMLPPLMLALPFKLIFFVLVDGWSVISTGLVMGYNN